MYFSPVIPFLPYFAIGHLEDILCPLEKFKEGFLPNTVPDDICTAKWQDSTWHLSNSGNVQQLFKHPSLLAPFWFLISIQSQRINFKFVLRNSSRVWLNIVEITLVFCETMNLDNVEEGDNLRRRWGTKKRLVKVSEKSWRWGMGSSEFTCWDEGEEVNGEPWISDCVFYLRSQGAAVMLCIEYICVFQSSTNFSLLWNPALLTRPNLCHFVFFSWFPRES